MMVTTRIVAFACVALVGALCSGRAWCAGFELIDNGTGTRQVVADGSTSVSVLKEDGSVWLMSNGRWKQIDTGARAIDAEAGWVYALKVDGTVHRFRDGLRQCIDSGTDTRQILAASRALYVLKASGSVYSNASGKWVRLYDGADGRMIAGDGAGHIYILKSDGTTWLRNRAGTWECADDGSNTAMIAAGGAGWLYVLKGNGNIWRRYVGANWEKIDPGSGTASIVADGNDLCALKADGDVWAFGNGWRKVFSGPGNRQIDVDYGKLYVLRTSGNLYRGDLATCTPFSVQEAQFDVLHGR